MGRWEPDAAGRLQQAALELYAERGFDDTPVAEIAARAGLTERTFFRHFADKREVLFRGSEDLQELMVRAVDEAPASATPMEAITRALEAPERFFTAARRAQSLQRQAVIEANPELRERELVKLASLGAALADALRRRGVPDAAAGLAAQAGVAAFGLTFQRWARGEGESDFARYAREAVAELQAVTSGR